ncbi:terminase family protein [Nitratireductor indicus]|nr:terminase family protein [Nitratireductor indicus]MDS1134605.1 terminase family protein [Nitratireductor indicus]
MRGWAGANLPHRLAPSIDEEWLSRARLSQYPLLPIFDTWLVTGGRGAGKTRLGAEWVNALVRGFPPFARGNRYGRIALVGETLIDAREVMVEGPSGILSIVRRHRPRFEPSRRRIIWDNGAVAQLFSAEDPDGLRGPQFDAAWCDELAKWRNADLAFDMLQFGLRLGALPLQLLTTTPRPTPLVRRLMNDPQVTVTRMRTAENQKNLAAGFLRAMERRYGGTRLGRQELDGELIEDRPDALWTRAMFDGEVQETAPEGLARIVVAVDPPAAARRTSDACGIVVAGTEAGGSGVVLHDGTVKAVTPREWATAAVALYHRFGADCLVAEVNQGGDMVAAVIATVDATVPVKPVRATRGKWLRAEPVAALYEQGRVRHAGRFPELEDEMCDFGLDGLSGGHSPDRVDALVWALTELMLGRVREPRIRNLD